MTTGLLINELTLEQQDLWQRVNDLWALSLTRNATEIRNTLHPRYVGWDMSSPTPHDREAAVQSVLGDSPVVTQYQLTPLSVEVYDHTVGVVLLVCFPASSAECSSRINSAIRVWKFNR